MIISFSFVSTTYVNVGQIGLVVGVKVGIVDSKTVGNGVVGEVVGSSYKRGIALYCIAP